MSTIKNNDLNVEETVNDTQADAVKGGALLLPAVQAAREAARTKSVSTLVATKFSSK